MRLKNLTKCYIYTPETVKVDGESLKKWKFKASYNLNVQQDISELDINSAGSIDYDRLKIRTDYDYDLAKNDGVSLQEIVLGDDGYTTTSPEYTIISNPKIGKVTKYTCEIYHGE